jgi:chromosome segregation ATPase
MDQTAQALERLVEAVGRLQLRLNQRETDAASKFSSLDQDNAALRASLSTLKRDMQAMEHANRKAVSAVEKAEKAIDQLIRELSARG